MSINEQVKKRINKLLDSQKIAVLGTSKSDEPYSCLVAFAFSDDLSEFVFATMRKVAGTDIPVRHWIELLAD